MTLELDDLIGYSRVTLLFLHANYRRNATELCDATGTDETEECELAVLFATNMDVLRRIDRALALKRKAGAR